MGFELGRPALGPLVLAASGALLAALALAVPGSSGASGATHGPLERPRTASPELVVDPVSWWMTAGNVSSFVGTWVYPNPACILLPHWYRWSIGGGSAEGSLNSTTGADVNFTATSAESGATTLVLRSAATLACGTQDSAIVAMAESNVTVATPVSIQNLSIGPNPITPGQSASLRGNVSGGEPPYTLRVDWGDSTASMASLPDNGTFTLAHTFPAGVYRPLLSVADSGGLLDQETVGTTLAVSDSVAVGLTADRSEVDAGMFVTLHASILDEPAGASTDWSCGPSTAVLSSHAVASTNFSCQFPQPGTDSALFELLPAGGLQPVSAQLALSVEPLPVLSPSFPNLTAEIGQPCLVGFTVSGGVPPFTLDWATVGSPNQSSVTVASDGTVWLPVDAASAGSLELVARLVDADGASASNSTVLLTVEPALADSFSSDRTTTPLGADLALAGSVSAGDPPFLWLVTPGLLPFNESDPTGSLPSVGQFVWSALYQAEGPTTITAIVVDASGAFTTTSLALEAVTPLAVTVSFGEEDPPLPDTFLLSLSFSGGLPPFAVDINASDGQRWDRNSSSDGNVTWMFAADVSGPLNLGVVTTDTLGHELEWNGTVEIAAGSTALPSGPPVTNSPSYPFTLTLGVLLGTGCLVAGYYAHRRRRTRPTSSALPDPASVLRQIIEPADGADRATVEILAEEAGIPLDLVRATIDRLIVAGSIRSETGSDGEEVVSWSATPRS